MLQKEQGLVTHTWPSEWRYTIAMGQGCPDTAACDTRYYGFFNQVYGAAWQLKRYANPPGTSQYFTWYAPGQDVERPLQPERRVRLVAGATSRTRRPRTSTTTRRTSRTPRRCAPGYGEGDGCSAYGNRNFYNYFTDWFGSTRRGQPVRQHRGRRGAARRQFHVTRVGRDPNTADPHRGPCVRGVGGHADHGDVDRADVGAAYPASGSARFHGDGARYRGRRRHGLRLRDQRRPRCECAPRAAGRAPAMSGSSDGHLRGGRRCGRRRAGDAAGRSTRIRWHPPPSTSTWTASGTAFHADVDRPDVARGYPGYGERTASRRTVSAPPGPHTRVRLRHQHRSGRPIQLGCRTVTVPGAADLGAAPIGNFEALTVCGTTATATAGRSIPTPRPRSRCTSTCGSARHRVRGRQAASRRRGRLPRLWRRPRLRRSRSTLADWARRTVCVYAINTGAGGHTAPRLPDGDRRGDDARPRTCPDRQLRSARSRLRAARPSPAGRSTLTRSAPIAVHIYVDGAGGAYLADKARGDVGPRDPGLGDGMASPSSSPCRPGRTGSASTPSTRRGRTHAARLPGRRRPVTCDVVSRERAGQVR